MSAPLHLVECPRDAMQGWKTLIPTSTKIRYLNKLLQVGFHTIDCGSFVSAKAIPQMADTADVIEQLLLHESKSKLLVIVANKRGAEEAIKFDNISYLGFPFSISPTFQMRNTNSSMEESFKRICEMQALCITNKKELVVYLSMAFGNPYGDDYSEEILLCWADKIVALGIKTISLADTVGVANPLQIRSALKALIPAYPSAQFGVHLHAAPATFNSKMDAAIEAGCKRFDGAIKGIGGCPMADDILVGNMNTELMIAYFDTINLPPVLNRQALAESILMAEQIFI